MYYSEREEAYSKVQQELEEMNEDSDPAIQNTAKSVPWRAICMGDASITETMLRKHFHRCEDPGHVGSEESRFDWVRNIMPHKNIDCSSFK